jgi:hypothetical protein
MCYGVWPFWGTVLLYITRVCILIGLCAFGFCTVVQCSVLHWGFTQYKYLYFVRVLRSMTIYRYCMYYCSVFFYIFLSINCQWHNSSHHLRKSGLSVSPFLCAGTWDAWLCRRSEPTTMVGSTSFRCCSVHCSILSWVSAKPLLEWSTPRWIHPPWSRPFILLRSPYPYWLLEYCPKLYCTVAIVWYGSG